MRDNALFNMVTAAIKPHNDVLVAKAVMGRLVEAAEDYAKLVEVNGFHRNAIAMQRAHDRLQRALESAKKNMEG